MPSDGGYRAGQTHAFTVNTDEAVTVDTAGGTPRLALVIGSSTVYANYASGSGTSALTFTYTVQPGDIDGDGIAVGALQSNGGTLKDAAGNNMTLALNSVGATTGVFVDTTAPAVGAVSVPSNGNYAAGQNLDFTVSFDEAVTVDTSGGMPRIALTLDTGGVVYATYLSGSGTSAVVFRYTVGSGVSDTNGVTVGTLSTGGGTLRDVAGNDATLALTGAGSTGAVMVDGIGPSVSSIDRVNTTPTNSSSVQYTATFSETVSGVDTSDFTLTTTGTAAGTIESVTPINGGTYTVTVNSLSGNGSLRLDLNSSSTGIIDTPGNALGGGFTSGQTYTLVHTAPGTPTISGLTAGTDTGSSPNDGVTSNPTPTLTGTAEANSIVRIYADGSSVGTATVSGSGEWDYTFGTALSAGTHDITADVTDALGNTSSRTGALPLVIDPTAPVATSIVRVDAPPSAPTVNYLVTFSEAVSGVDITDFTLARTGNVGGQVTAVTQVDDRTFSVTLSGVRGSGTLRLDLNGTGTGIADQAGNVTSAGISSNPISLVDVPPVILVSAPQTLDIINTSTIDTSAGRPTAPLVNALANSVSTLQPTHAFSSSEGSHELISRPPSVSTLVSSEVELNDDNTFEFSLPVWSSMDFSSWSVVEMRTADGTSAPPWLHLDSTSGTLQGTAPEGFHGTLRLELVVTDRSGVHRAGIVQLHFGDGRHHSQSDSAERPRAGAIPSKPDLDAQFSHHARAMPISTEAARALRQLHTRSVYRASFVPPPAAEAAAQSQGNHP